VFIKASYSKIEGLCTNPITRQADLEQYLYRKNGILAKAVGTNPEFIKLFTSLVNMLKAYAVTRGKSYSDLFVDKATYTLDDIFYFDIKFGTIE
jgi:hypothetical protein